MVLIISLIPKKKYPWRVLDSSLTSLCNVIYKIEAKVLANRLKNIMPKLISTIQSAFISRHQIMDNVLVGYELMHYLNLKKRGETRFMSLKIDINKAYDHVE